MLTRRGSKPKSRHILERQLVLLRKLLRGTGQSHRDFPLLLARIGSGYSQLAASLEAVSGANAQALRRGAREHAIRHFELLVREYPKFCVVQTQQRRRGCADDWLHHLAFERFALGDDSGARQPWLVIVNDWPESDFRAAAFAGLAAIASRERDHVAAAQLLEDAAALEHPRLGAYAHVELARVLETLGESSASAQARQLAAAHARQYPDAAAAAAIMDAL